MKKLFILLTSVIVYHSSSAFWPFTPWHTVPHSKELEAKNAELAGRCSKLESENKDLVQRNTSLVLDIIDKEEEIKTLQTQLLYFVIAYKALCTIFKESSYSHAFNVAYKNLKSEWIALDNNPENMSNVEKKTEILNEVVRRELRDCEEHFKQKHHIEIKNNLIEQLNMHKNN